MDVTIRVGDPANVVGGAPTGVIPVLGTARDLSGMKHAVWIPATAEMVADGTAALVVEAMMRERFHRVFFPWEYPDRPAFPVFVLWPWVERLADARPVMAVRVRWAMHRPRRAERRTRCRPR
jgi:hypothetical protein